MESKIFSASFPELFSSSYCIYKSSLLELIFAIGNFDYIIL